ncbi:hypothetical protein [Tolypothrix sp. VBCCA 56010]|uniref:hypothetical protein n=1 Tax=Tolypothrix sp. VBCCA 56010 TaxID=3137731 RepID=UPI003D7C4E13
MGHFQPRFGAGSRCSSHQAAWLNHTGMMLSSFPCNLGAYKDYRQANNATGRALTNQQGRYFSKI